MHLKVTWAAFMAVALTIRNVNIALNRGCGGSGFVTIQSRRCGLRGGERQDRDKVSDAKSRKQRPSIDGAAGPSSRRVVRKGKAMIHSSRRDRKAKAIAEVLAMIANAQARLAPHRPRPVLEADERLFETAAEFCAALEKYAECATKIERVNH